MNPVRNSPPQSEGRASVGAISNGVKIFYVANIRMPTERAHGIQIVKTCEALAKLGVHIELVVPRRRTSIEEPLFSYYGIQPLFTVTTTAVLDVLSLGRIGYGIEVVSFALSALRRVFWTRDIVYSRDEIVLFFAWLAGARHVVWESHTGSWNFFARFIAKRVQKVVVISRGLLRYYRERGLPPEKLLVAPDGVDLAMFEHVISKQEARARLGLSENEWIALYVGGLGGWKGVQTLLEASTLMPEGYTIAVIGGTAKETHELSQRYPRVRFLGERPYRDVANNQVAADALVLPNTARDTISAQFTSPLKLFTYMASGIPIVAADLPSVREIIDATAAYFFSPDDPKGLAESLWHVRTESGEAAHRAQVAKRIAGRYTWEARARVILACLVDSRP